MEQKHPFAGIEEQLKKVLGPGKLIKIGSLGDLGKVLGVDDCGKDDCPVHGNQQPETDYENIDADRALDLAKQAAAAADDSLRDGDEDSGRVWQRQSQLWLIIHETERKQDSNLEALVEKATGIAMQRAADEIRRLQTQREDALEEVEEMRGRNGDLAAENQTLRDRISELESNASNAKEPGPVF